MRMHTHIFVCMIAGVYVHKLIYALDGWMNSHGWVNMHTLVLSEI